MDCVAPRAAGARSARGRVWRRRPGPFESADRHFYLHVLFFFYRLYLELATF